MVKTPTEQAISYFEEHQRFLKRRGMPLNEHERIAIKAMQEQLRRNKKVYD